MLTRIARARSRLFLFAGKALLTISILGAEAGRAYQAWHETLGDPIMLLRAFGVWCAFVLMAILNGAMRESVITPRLGADRGGQLSAILLALMIFLVTYFAIRWIALRDAGDAWLVGFCWLLLVLLFEFGLGRVQGMTWSAMLEEYQFWRGKLWVLVLLSATTAPFLAARIRHLI